MASNVAQGLPPVPFPPQPPSPDKPKKNHRSRDSERDSKRLSRSSRELVRLLLNEERESNELQQMLLQVTEQLKFEKQRADDAEQRVKEAIVHMKTLNTARLAAQQDASQASRELVMYKAQLDAAQNEILRAQRILATLEAQKHEAEADAARARTTARQFRQEKLIADAREEGRRLGLQEGLERGRELGYQRGRATGYAHGRSNAQRAMEEYDEQEEVSNPSPPEHLPHPASEILATTEAPALARDVGTPDPRNPPTSRPVDRDHIRPTMVHNVAPSAQHPLVDIPPDNFIPRADEDSVIRIPPPHELSRPYTPESASGRRPAVPEEPALMIPPVIHRVESTSSIPRSNSSTPRQRRRRRHSSPESGSTTISQLDMLNEPSQPPTRATTGSPLSVIQEVLSVQASPNHTTTSEGSLGPSRVSVALE